MNRPQKRGYGPIRIVGPRLLVVRALILSNIRPRQRVYALGLLEAWIDRLGGNYLVIARAPIGRAPRYSLTATVRIGINASSGAGWGGATPANQFPRA